MKFPRLIWGPAAELIGKLQAALKQQYADNLLLLREARLAQADAREARRDAELLAKLSEEPR